MGFSARDLMQKDVGIVDAAASLDDLERAFEDARVSGFPVVERGRVVGVISRADVIRQLAEGGRRPIGLSDFYAGLGAFEAEEILETFSQAAQRSGRRSEELRVEDLMTRSIVAVSPDDDVADVARTLVDNKVHRALVVDDTALVGIVSSLDVVRLVAEGKLAPGRADTREDAR